MYNPPYECKSFLESTLTRQSQIEPYDIAHFKSKFIFKPFQYEERLQQTLKYQIDSLNAKPPRPKAAFNTHSHVNSINFQQNHSLKSSNVRFGIAGSSNNDSYNTTAKTINTFETIVEEPHLPHFTRQQKKDPSIVPTLKSPFAQLDLKKTISFTNNKTQPTSSFEPNIQTEHKPNRIFKKGLNNKKKYEEEQKEKGLFLHKKNFSSNKTSENHIAQTSAKSSLESIQEKQGSMCLSIALESLLIQNFIKATFENSLNNSHFFTNPAVAVPVNRNASTANAQEPMNFYQFCMLLFPETPKSLPCSIPIMDTLFYLNTPENKEIIYVFKDKKRNLLMKMKNKNKSAYELFMKRRGQYEVVRAREEKLRKTGWFDGKEGMIINNGSKQNWMLNSMSKSKWKNTQKSSGTKEVKFRTIESFAISSNNKMVKSLSKGKKFEASVKCLEDEETNLLKKLEKNSIAEEDEVVTSRPAIKGTQKVINVTVQEDDEKDEGRDSLVLQRNEESDLVQKNRDSGLSSSSGLSYMSYHSGMTEDLKSKIMTNMDFEKTFGNEQFGSQNSNSIINQPSCKALKSPTKHSITHPSNQNTTPSQHSPTEQASILSSPRLTPSNSIRESIHTLQTNYVAILKYLNNQTIRLKQQEFKAIFHNPLYANERFKNNNNTQYIQALPIEDEFKDLKVYSIHFHYELFKEEPLFKYVKESLFKENEYMANNASNMAAKSNPPEEKEDLGMSMSHNVRTKTSVFESRSPQNIKNQELKQRLKHECVEVYLYYQIFEMYTYASMHYNKQILNGIFRFIEYDNQLVLFETQNIVSKNLPVEGEFIKAKIFAEEASDEFNTDELLSKLKLRTKQTTPMTTTITTHENLTTGFTSGTQTPSQTMKKINKELLKLTLEDCGINIQLTELQKELLGYFSQRNNLIEQEMSTYFTEKIQKIKNIKDSHLSKNIFKIINSLPVNSQTTDVGKLQNQNRKIESQKPNQPLNLRSSLSSYAKNGPVQSDSIDFHSILNDEKKLEKFLKEKEQNDPYARKNISNYSVVRWKQQIKKVKERKSHNMTTQADMSVQYQPIDQSQIQENDGKKYGARPMTACSIGKSRQAESRGKFTKINTTDLGFTKSTSCQKQNVSAFQKSKPAGFISTYSSTQPVDKGFQLQNKKVNCTSPVNAFAQNEKEAKRFEKKLINERYTQVNKAKFTFNSFKTNKIF